MQYYDVLRSEQSKDEDQNAWNLRKFPINMFRTCCQDTSQDSPVDFKLASEGQWLTEASILSTHLRNPAVHYATISANFTAKFTDKFSAKFIPFFIWRPFIFQRQQYRQAI